MKSWMDMHAASMMNKLQSMLLRVLYYTIYTPFCVCNDDNTFHIIWGYDINVA